MDIFGDLPDAPAYLVDDEHDPGTDLDTFTSETSSFHSMSTLASEEAAGPYGVTFICHLPQYSALFPRNFDSFEEKCH